MMILMNKKIKIKFAELLDICTSILFNKKYLTFATYDVILKKKLKI